MQRLTFYNPLKLKIAIVEDLLYQTLKAETIKRMPCSLKPVFCVCQNGLSEMLTIRGWCIIIRTDIFRYSGYNFALRALIDKNKSFIVKSSLKWGTVHLCSSTTIENIHQNAFSVKSQYLRFCNLFFLKFWGLRIFTYSDQNFHLSALKH